MNLKRPVVLALLAHVYLALNTSAQSTNWLLPGDGNWNDAANWSAGVPNSSTVAAFNYPTFTSATVNDAANANVRGIISNGTAGVHTTLNIVTGTTAIFPFTVGPSGILANDSDVSITGFVQLAGNQFWFASQDSQINVSSLSIAPGFGNTTLTNQGTGSNAFIRFGGGGIDLSNTTSNLTLAGSSSAARYGLSASQSWRVGGTATAPQTLTAADGTNLDLGTGHTLTLSPHKLNAPLPMHAIVLNSRLTGSSTLRVSPTRPIGSGGEDAVGTGLVEIGGTQPNVNTGPIIVDGGTLYLRKAAATAGTSMTLNGGQVLVQAGITNAMPATTNLVMTAHSYYNRGLPTADGTSTDAPTAHTQTFASVNFQAGGSGAIFGDFNTGGGTIAVTGTFTASGQGQVNVSPGGTMTVNRLNMTVQPSFGFVSINSGTTGAERGTLIIGAGGLNMDGRRIQLTSPLASNFGSILLLEGDVTVAGSSSILRTGSGAHQVHLAGQRTFTVAQNASLTTTVTHTNAVGTTGGIRKEGPGTMWYEAVGSYNGSLQVAAGRFVMASSAAVPDTTFVWIQGGQLSTAGGRGITGGPNGAGVSERAGPLVVQTATSSVELGTGAHVLSFTALSGAGAETFPGDTHLTVFGWQGTAGNAGTAGRLVFGTDGGFTPDILSRITFDGYSPGAELIAYSGFEGNFELVPVLIPVPEPATVLGIAAVGLAANRLRKRFKK